MNDKNKIKTDNLKEFLDETTEEKKESLEDKKNIRINPNLNREEIEVVSRKNQLK